MNHDTGAPSVDGDRPTGFSTPAILSALSALSLLVLLPDLGGRPIWQVDQVQRAQAAVEMFRTGDWVIPRVGGAPYAYYPPMGYWTIAAPALVLGMSDAVARLPSAIAGWLAVLVLFGIGARVMDRTRGAAASAILALTPGFIHLGRIVAPDMLLVLCQMLLIALFLEWLADAETDRRRPWIVPGMIGAGGVGILAKGPAAVAFPLAAGLVYLAFTGRLGTLRRFPWAATALGMALVALPWCAAVALRPEGGVFFDKFINENFRAPLGMDLHVNGPAYYILRMPPRALPWVLLLPAALLDGSWTRKETRLGWCWLLTVLAVLTASASKRPTYFVFLFPPLALLLGDAAGRLIGGGSSPRARAAFRAALILLSVGSAGFAGMLLFHPQPFRALSWYDHRQPLAAAAAGIALLTGGLAVRRDALIQLAVMGAATAVGLFAHAAWIERDADPEELRAAAFCRKVESIVPAAEPLWTIHGLHPKFRYNIHRDFRLWPTKPDAFQYRPRYVLVTFDVPPDTKCLGGAETLAEEMIEQEERTRLVRTAPGAGNH